MPTIEQTVEGRLPLGGFRPGQVVRIHGQTAFILGRSTHNGEDVLDCLWVDSVGYIVILQYTPAQLRDLFGNTHSYTDNGYGCCAMCTRIGVRATPDAPLDHWSAARAGS